MNHQLVASSQKLASFCIATFGSWLMPPSQRGTHPTEPDKLSDDEASARFVEAHRHKNKLSITG
jgi:hypothetical protein